jgi:hypothetical protein
VRFPRVSSPYDPYECVTSCQKFTQAATAPTWQDVQHTEGSCGDVETETTPRFRRSADDSSFDVSWHYTEESVCDAEASSSRGAGASFLRETAYLHGRGRGHLVGLEAKLECGANGEGAHEAGRAGDRPRKRVRFEDAA